MTRALFLRVLTVVLFCVGLTNCTYKSTALDDVRCDKNGQIDGQRQCQDGIWVQYDGLDMPLDLQTDMPADLPPDIPKDMCTPEDDVTFCKRLGACGQLSETDNCGIMRQNIDCGGCGTDQTCTNNTCTCVPESNTLFCGRLSAQCGLKKGLDNCNKDREVQCGDCNGANDCQADNTCPICLAETEMQFCARLGATCGSRTAPNNCGDMKTVDCGGCGADESCTNNMCVCDPAQCSNAQVCGQIRNACGETTSCGNCGTDERCTGDNRCVCRRPTCANDSCGRITNQCNRSVECGDCAQGEMCNNNNRCVCAPETDAAFCTRTGATCGSKTAMDNCGDPRTVNCGGCGADESCTNNACVCDPVQCTAQQTCDTVTNACNNSKDCGTCATDEVCTNNSCECVPETDAAFCTRTNTVCGSRTAPNNCGDMKTIDCGGCGADESCTNNMCVCDIVACPTDSCGTVTNACNNTIECGVCNGNRMCINNTCCAPDNDGKFCMFIGAACGVASGTDNCGVMRQGVDCGMCPNGRACTNNMCN